MAFHKKNRNGTRNMTTVAKIFLVSRAPAAAPDSSAIQMGMQQGQVRRVRPPQKADRKLQAPFGFFGDFMGSLFQRPLPKRISNQPNSVPSPNAQTIITTRA